MPRRPLTILLATLALAAVPLAVAAAQTVYHRCNDGDPETLDAHKTSNVSEMSS